ncbi:DNA-binding transcriptional regulator, GntR family [Agrococcus baldri]|uniref:DNA-binding transcriptional regulator, GntR family n=1 Tax=Agrococcus baldri TaxID=153730 RepID=A0AA94HQI0_9MICO|nr:GntR family transcriptional regulator [Agrococcus baldri]SFS18470.1 DNA-binding transcriptional regulator, GntR family [Agrococcus baldri]
MADDRSPLHGATLADALRAQIIDGAFAPGERLSETALAERLDVSRNTLREAFRVLAQVGLVEHIPHRGVSVASPTTADVVDIYRARRQLECGVLREASPLHPAVAQMHEALERAEAAEAESDWATVGSENMRFHSALVSLADSPRISRAHEQLQAELRLAFLAIDDPQSLHRPFVAKNRAVLEALDGDGPAAAAAELERYLVDSERRVLGAFSRMGRA